MNELEKAIKRFHCPICEKVVKGECIYVESNSTRKLILTTTKCQNCNLDLTWSAVGWTIRNSEDNNKFG